MFDELSAEILYQISGEVLAAEGKRNQHKFLFCLSKKIRQKMMSSRLRIPVEATLYVFKEHCTVFRTPKSVVSKVISIETARELVSALNFKKVFFNYESFGTLQEVFQGKQMRTLVLIDTKRDAIESIESIRGVVEKLKILLYRQDKKELKISLNQGLVIKEFVFHHELPTTPSAFSIRYQGKLEKLKLAGGIMKLESLPECRTLCLHDIRGPQDLTSIKAETIVLVNPVLCESVDLDCVQFLYRSDDQAESNLSLINFPTRKEVDRIVLEAYENSRHSLEFVISGPRRIGELSVRLNKAGFVNEIMDLKKILLRFTTDGNIEIGKLQVSCKIDTRLTDSETISSAFDDLIDSIRCNICFFGNCKTIAIDELFIKSDNSPEKQEYMLVSNHTRIEVKVLKARKNSKVQTENVYVKSLECFENMYDRFLEYYGGD